MIKPRVKVCCISSLDEAKLAIRHGASALGLVSNMPSGPGVISEDLIAEISKEVPPPISTFLLTSKTRASQIIKQYNKVQTTTIQIVDEIEFKEYRLIRDALPHVKLVQVVHVLNEKSIHKAIEISKYVDALLLDSGNPNLAVKELGGTGRTHNWEFSREIRRSIAIPVFLAGGLNQNNVVKAIKYVKPFGIDLCSGVRKNGNLDSKKLINFFSEIKKIH